MAITRLSGGLTPANGADPRTFPAVWNGTADDLEAGEYSRVPQGGSAGEVLVKQSATDFDLGYKVRAEAWQPASGVYYGAVSNTTVALPLDELIYTPFVFPRATSVDAIAVNRTAGGSAGSVIRLGLYAPDADGIPADLIVDAGTAATDSGGILIITFTPVTVSGLVYFAGVSNVDTFTVRALTTGAYAYDYIGARATDAFNGKLVYSESGVTGALPSTATPVFGRVNSYAIRVRVA
jgi:hypothetical protein